MKSKILGFWIFTFISIWFSSCDGLNTQYKKGYQIYASQCANCHMADGSGLGSFIPSLNVVPKQDYGSKVCTIWMGQGEGSLKMPSYSNLTEIEMTNLINYLNEKFGNQKSYFPKTVDSLMMKCLK